MIAPDLRYDGRMNKRALAAPFLFTSLAFADATLPPKKLPKAPDALKVTKREDGSCWYFAGTPHCPPNVRCNPPPPRQVECPPEKLPKAPDEKRVFRRPDGSCWYDEPVHCPPGATCNPPPPMQVECPAKK